MIAKYGTFESPLAGRYRLDGVLGRGGTGTVYRATDARLGRSVAIKMLHEAFTGEIGIKRFESEIRITAGLHHPSITTVHDCGEVDGCLYYVMEDLGGESLRARLERDAQLSIADAVAIAEQIGGGLQYAHDHSVIHRDVKPENIILADGRACIVDFGLARVINDAGSQRLTESGVTVGTPQYLSPEQAGAEKLIGPGADQYALACVLFEMLVGEPPFTGPTATAIAMRHMSDSPPSLRARRPDAPPGLGAAIQRALNKTPDDRFASVHDFMIAAAAAASSNLGRGGAGDTTPPRRRSLFQVLKSYWTSAIVLTLLARGTR